MRINKVVFGLVIAALLALIVILYLGFRKDGRVEAVTGADLVKDPVVVYANEKQPVAFQSLELTGMGMGQSTVAGKDGQPKTVDTIGISVHLAGTDTPRQMFSCYLGNEMSLSGYRLRCVELHTGSKKGDFAVLEITKEKSEER